MEKGDTPNTLLKLLKKISPSKLKSSLSFLHRHHVDRLKAYLYFCLDKKLELELVWRVCEALDIQEPDLSKGLRQSWEEDRDIIRVNIEALKLVGKVLQQNREMSLL